jgi:hypothetical protein
VWRWMLGGWSFIQHGNVGWRKPSRETRIYHVAICSRLADRYSQKHQCKSRQERDADNVCVGVGGVQCLDPSGRVSCVSCMFCSTVATLRLYDKRDLPQQQLDVQAQPDITDKAGPKPRIIISPANLVSRPHTK